MNKSEALTPEQLQVVNNVKTETLLSLQEIRTEFVEEISTSNTYEDVVEAIGADGLLDVLPHPDQQKYLGQNIYVVSALGYVYLVPYVTDNERIFLKTIIPSRRAKKIYQES